MNDILIIKRHAISEGLISYFQEKQYNPHVVKGPLYTSHYLKEKQIKVILFYFDQIHEDEQMEIIDVLNKNSHIPIIIVKKDYSVEDHLLSILEATQKQIDFLETKEKFVEVIDSLVFEEKRIPETQQTKDSLDNLEFNKMFESERTKVLQKEDDKIDFEPKNYNRDGLVSNAEKDLLSSL